MQIKTLLHLVTGAGVGYLVFADDENKEKIVHSIKKTLYKWQTGEDIDKKKKSVSYNTNYCSYKPKTENAKVINVDDELTKMFTFNKCDAAEDYLSMLRGIFVDDVISLIDFFNMYKKEIPYTYNNYGWTFEELTNAKIIKMPITGKYMIDLPKYHYLV